MATTVPLTGFRNVPFPPEVITFTEAGVARNFTGKTFAMDVRALAGTGPALISLNVATDDTMDGVRAVNAAAGQLRFQIGQAAMQAAWDAAYAAGLMKAGEPVALVYDLLVIDTDGLPEAVIEGSFTIHPGVTL